MTKKSKSKSLKRQPKTQKALETKKVILRATTQILLRDGVDSLNTNSIASTAGVSIGTLYQYYDDKEDIINELLHQVIDGRVKRIKDSMSLGMVFDSIEVIVSKIVDAIIEGTSEEAAKLETILLPYAMMSKRSLLFNRVKIGNDVFMPILKVLITAKLRGLKGRNLETVSFMLVQATRAIVLGSLLYPNPQISDKEMRKELKTLILGFLKD